LEECAGHGALHIFRLLEQDLHCGKMQQPALLGGEPGAARRWSNRSTDAEAAFLKRNLSSTHLFQATGIVSVIDTATNSVVATITLAGFEPQPFGIAITPAKKSAADLITGLVNFVSTLNLQNGIANSLDAKLQAAQASLAAAKANNLNTACNQIDAFINAVIAQSGNQLAVDPTNQLLVQAAQIRTALGCS
jgi:YVTN family beta-propeller protein